LEQLWLPIRKQPEGAFYKGLIQLAGAFVHLQKKRAGPSAALLKLARHNLESFAPQHLRLDVGDVVALIDQWLARLEGPGQELELLTTVTAPKLGLAGA